MENVLPVQPAKKSNKKKYIIGAVVLGVLLMGLATALILVGRQQLFKQEASVPTGVATVRITPTQKTVAVNEQFTADVFFNTANRAIGAIAVQLEYSFTGAEPPIKALNVETSTALVADNWNFSVKSVATEGQKVIIQIGGTNSDNEGYTNNADTKLATINFSGMSPGKIVVNFNATESKIKDLAANEDILLTPESSGTYTVGGGGSPTATATATASSSPTGAGSPTPTGSGTPRSTATTTPTPTDGGGGGDEPTPPPVPDSGVGTPTILGIGLGIILLIIPLALAL